MRCQGLLCDIQAQVKELTLSIKGGIDTDAGKVNVLLQAYISKAPIEDFSLVSDTAYIAQVRLPRHPRVVQS